MKKFDIPEFYRSPLITKIKDIRKHFDKTKKDFTPTILDFGPVRISIARHFGFCFGVENAIEIVYKIIQEYPDKNIYLLSEMIHNPLVNEDLEAQGVKFIMDTKGNNLISWDKINSEDIVITPAFGTTVEIEKLIKDKKISTEKYNTTCPFVERVWKKSAKLSDEDCTIIIHGKHVHEETRATFSHSKKTGIALVIQNIDEAKELALFMKGEKSQEEFSVFFKDRYSHDFNIKKDLVKIGVVNQTTMLATETEEIANFLKTTMETIYDKESIDLHFADTRDTLCYATADNQTAIQGLLKEQTGDFSIVVGGYNSSNTSHLVELCEKSLPTFHISDEKKILNKHEISHFKFRTGIEITTQNFIDYTKEKTDILISSGASCPDAIVENIIVKLLSFFENARSIDEVYLELTNQKF